MKNLNIKVQLGNDAMQHLDEAKAAILFAIRKMVETGAKSHPIYDVNGNKVGVAKVT